MIALQTDRPRPPAVAAWPNLELDVLHAIWTMGHREGAQWQRVRTEAGPWWTYGVTLAVGICLGVTLCWAAMSAL